jgi:hypothetical protein
MLKFWINSKYIIFAFNLLFLLFDVKFDKKFNIFFQKFYLFDIQLQL